MVLTGKRFATDAEVHKAVTSWLQTRDNDFFYAGIKALVPRWEKRINISDYLVEVCCVLSAIPMCKTYEYIAVKILDIWECAALFFIIRLYIPRPQIFVL